MLGIILSKILADEFVLVPMLLLALNATGVLDLAPSALAQSRTVLLLRSGAAAAGGEFEHGGVHSEIWIHLAFSWDWVVTVVLK